MEMQLEFPQLAEALYLALKEDGFYQTMEESVQGDSKAKKNAMLCYMDYSIIEAQEYGECFLPEKQNYGVSIWQYPLSIDKSKERDLKKKNYIQKWMGKPSYNAYLEMCNNMSRLTQSLIEENSWYLSIIGILPDFQGQGLGPGLVESTLEKTDNLKVSTYLETFTPRNMNFYKRLGYIVKGEIEEPFSKETYWVMERAAK